MMKRLQKRILSFFLVLAMLVSLCPTAVLAANGGDEKKTALSAQAVTDLSEEEKASLLASGLDFSQVVDPGDRALPAADDLVDVIIELNVPSVYEIQQGNAQYRAMDFSDFVQSDAAREQLRSIASAQADVQLQMVRQELEVTPVYTYAALLSGFSARVRFGDIAAMEQIPGVKRVVMSVLYEKEETPDETCDEAGGAVYPAGSVYANTTDFQGDGMLIGILDTGLDYSHEAFANAPRTQKLTKEDLTPLLYEEKEDGTVSCYSFASYLSAAGAGHILTEDELYKSAKVPFAFDYADYDPEVCPSEYAVTNFGNDHGTHVAGIAAGKAVDEAGNVTFAGAAPEAQLAIFKVFSDRSSGASTASIVAGLSDALLLGVDVINMSLGSGGGFGAEDSDSLLTEIYSMIEESGISLCVSAGNSYSSAYGAAAGDYATTANPDYGIVSSPSSYSASLSVASINAGADSVFLLGEEQLTYTEVSGHSFAAELGDGTYAYVLVPGAGDAADYEGLDAAGKIAVIQRGGITFDQKQLNAAAAGAKACIIYNNRAGEAVNMSIENWRIPTASLTLENGTKLAGAAVRELTVDSAVSGSASMSAFSSWGPLPSLELKPEITAPGGGIYSAVPFNNAYDYMSGTSMASPYLAGVAAALRERLQRQNPELTATELETLTARLLMSTATPVTSGDGVPVSPRKQGAGLVNLANALATDTYLYVAGTERTKVELGDDPRQTGVYDISFHVANTGADARVFALSTEVLTEAVTADGGYLAQKDRLLSAGTAVSVSGGTYADGILTVPAGGDAAVTVTVELSSDDRTVLDAFANGCYVEGFVSLASRDGGVNLSIPYLGFYGDWTKAPMLDRDVFSGESADVFASTVYGIFNDQYLMAPGNYLLTLPEGVEAPAFSEEKIAMSLNAGAGFGYLYYLPLGLLRGAKSAKTVIADRDTGEVYASVENTNVRKAMYNQTSGVMNPGLVGDIYPNYNAMRPSGLDNNTRLTVSAEVSVDASEPHRNENSVFSFHMTVDYEAPYVVNRDSLSFYQGDDGRVYLDVTFEDNQYLMGATLFSAGRTITGGIAAANQYYDYFTPLVHEDGSDVGPGEQVTVTYDVTDFYDKLYEGTFYIVAYDYACNTSVYRVTVDQVALTGMELNATEMTLRRNETAQLSVAFTPFDATDKRIKWTSSDPGVVLVKEGEITAMAPGKATVTAVSEADGSISASCVVTVSEEAVEGIDVQTLSLNPSALSLAAGGTATLTAAYTPYNATNRTLTWTTSDAAVATVTGGVVTAVGAGSAVITAETSNGITAKCSVLVHEADGEFTIEDNVLVKYNGTEAVVSIPDGVTAVAKEAFYRNTSVQKIVVPDSVETIGEGAMRSCSQLTTVVFGENSGLKTIEKNAFSSDSLLAEVTLPEGLETIGDSAFANCASLVSVTVPASVHTLGNKVFETARMLARVHFAGDPANIGTEVFKSCYSLTTVTGELTHIEEKMFSYCYSLGDFRLPEKVTYIAARAFDHCQPSTNVNLTNGNGYIDCTGLTRLIFTKESRFQAVDGVIGGMLTTTCPAFEGYVVEAGNAYLKVDGNGWVMSQDGTYIIDGVHDETLTSLTVPGGVRFVGPAAFADCVGLQTLNLPDGLEYIGECAFSSTSAMPTTSTISATNKARIALTAISIPDTVKEIGSFAFYGCSQAQSIQFGNALVSIGDCAFANCDTARLISFGESLQTIGAYAFYNCKLAGELVLPDTLAELDKYAFYSCAAAKTIDAGGLTDIPNYAFYGCGALTELTLPENLETIGTYAFYRCSALEEIRFPDTLRSIGSNAFNMAYALRRLDLGNTQVTKIDGSAFKLMRNIEELVFPQTLESIGLEAFGSMNSDNEGPVVSAVTIPAKVSSINKNAFKTCNYITRFIVDEDNETYYSDDTGAIRLRKDDSVLITPSASVSVTENFTIPETVTVVSSGFLQNNTTIRTLVVPGHVTAIESNAFRGCTNLESVVFERSDTELTVGVSAFYGCTALKTVEFAEGLTALGGSAFAHCSALTEITNLPGTLTTLGTSTFAGCTDLTCVVLPDSVVSVGTALFDGCTGLETVTLSQNLTALPGYAFRGCTALKEVRIPAKTVSVAFDTSVFAGCTQLEAVTVAPDNRAYRSEDGVVFDRNGKTLRYYPVAKPGASYTVPETVTRIGELAFQDNVTLTGITLPASVTRIGDGAFYGCSGLTTYRFEGMSAPLLECYNYYSSQEIARYRNFKDYYFDITNTGELVQKDLGLTLYCPAGSQGYQARLWQAFFGTIFVEDESLFTVPELTAVEAEGRTARLTWTPAPQAALEEVAYTVERAVAVRCETDGQETWVYDEFETLAQGLTECAYTDATALAFGRTYAYRVSAYAVADRETGPAAVATLYIAADEGNADEMAVLELIRAIEALKPVELLTLEDQARVEDLLRQYSELTEAQKNLIPNYDVLRAALDWLDELRARAVENLIDALPGQITVADGDAIRAARDAYDRLTEAQKALVDNYQLLLDAEELLSHLLDCEDGNHSYGSWTVTAAPDCTQEGKRERVCAYCGHTDEEALPALGHTWGEWECTLEATCFADGVQTRRCAVCQETESRAIPANSDNCPSAAFTDLNTGAWYHESVDFVLSRDLMNGVGGGRFAPNGELTRAQMVTVLYRMAGSPAVKGQAPFADVVSNRYYADAVAWAYENGITCGVSETRFAPQIAVTREQLVTFLYRYAEVSGVDLNAAGDLERFPDAARVSTYARESMIWAVSAGLIYGNANGGVTLLAPKGTATRAQIAAVMMRYLLKFPQ